MAYFNWSEGTDIGNPKLIAKRTFNLQRHPLRIDLDTKILASASRLAAFPPGLQAVSLFMVLPLSVPAILISSLLLVAACITREMGAGEREKVAEHKSG